MTEKKAVGRPTVVKDGQTKNIYFTGEQFKWLKSKGNISKAARDAVDLAIEAEKNPPTEKD